MVSNSFSCQWFWIQPWWMICIIAVGNVTMVKMYSDPSLILHLTTASFIRFFDVSFMLDLIFDNKQKRPPISIIPILTLKNGPWLQQCNKEEENSVVFPAKNALYLKNCQLSCISVIVWKWLKNVSIYNVANIFWIPKRNNCVICAHFWL